MDSFEFKVVGRLCEARGSQRGLLGRFDEFPKYFLPLNMSQQAEESNSPGESITHDSDSADRIINDIHSSLPFVESNRVNLYNSGVVEHLVNLLRTHLGTSGKVVYNVIKSIAILATG